MVTSGDIGPGLASTATEKAAPGTPVRRQPAPHMAVSSETKTLCIGFLGADWWGSDARAMAAEFRRRGHLLAERHYEDWLPTKWSGTFLKAARRLLRPVIARAYNAAVLQLLSVQALDFLLVFKGMLLQPEILAKFKQAGVPCYCFYPDVSFLDHGSNIFRSLRHYDCLITTKSYHLADPLLRKEVRRMEFAGHGFDPEVHREVTISTKLANSYGCDVSFVGAWSPKKDACLAGLIEACPGLNLRIWGPAWNRASSRVRPAWQGRGAYGDELAAIYGSSKVNLGLLSEAGGGVASGDATTARTWQIPASRGFLLHEDTGEVRRYFEEGKEIALFQNVPELVARVNHYLRSATEREAVRDAGWRRAHTGPYSYAPAVDRILEIHRELQDSFAK